MTAELLDGLLRANLALGAAILLVLALRRPLRRALGARAAYGLWLAPPAIAAAGFLPAPQGGLAQVVAIAPALRWTASATQAPALGQGLIAGLWVVGALACGAALTRRQIRFCAALGELRPAILAGRRVWRAARPAVGPALVGRAIVVPSDFETRFTAQEQDAILAHECVHLARGDVAVNMLVALAQCLCWFNPLVHLAAFTVRLDQELACDAAVIEARPALRRSYAEALLKTQVMAGAPPVGCTWPSRAQHPLKERISMLKASPPTRLRRVLGAGLLAGLTLGGACAAWAAQPGHGGLITNPDWAQRPTGADLVRFYPPTALKRHAQGMAVIGCRVGVGGELSACRVIRQSPSGDGFGEAGLKLATVFRMKPRTVDGAPVSGGTVRIPIKFAIMEPKRVR